MNIWLPIITNSILALILIAGIFVGKKNGLLEIIKLPFVLCAWVGCYFLNPIVVEWLAGMEFIQNLLTLSSIPAFIAITLSTLCFISYALISILFLIIRKATSRSKIKSINGAKKIKVKGIDRKTNKALKREENKINKELKKIGKGKQITGAILGFIIAACLGFVMMFSMKYIFKDIAFSDNRLEEITSGYEYTAYGQLDKVTEVYNSILIDQFNKLGE